MSTERHAELRGTSLPRFGPKTRAFVVFTSAVAFWAAVALGAGVELNRLLWIRAGACDAPGIPELLERGANPDWIGPGGRTSLEIAVDHRCVEVVRVLLKAGANPDPRSSDYSGPLYQAILLHPKSGLAELLLQYGADPNGVVTPSGETPLYPAIRHRDLALVRLLIERGANVNHQGRTGQTPLMTAVMVDNAIIARLLLERGADLNLETIHGSSATRLALSPGNSPQIAHVLLDYGADPKEVDFLSAALAWKDESLLRKVIANGADVNRIPGRAITPLALAVHYDNAEGLRILLEAGANPQIVDSDGETPYAQALRRQRHEILKVFNEYGVRD